MKLNKQETAMVLAGLRLLQGYVGGRVQCDTQFSFAVEEILADGEVNVGRVPQAVDALCERIDGAE